MLKQDTNEIKYLSDKMIENQAITDLLKYGKLMGKKLEFPLFPEEILGKLWGVRIEYADSLGGSNNEQVLASYFPSQKKVVINTKENENQGRLSFSIAHEVGHASLHSFAIKENQPQDKSKKHDCDFYLFEDVAKKIEEQADKYAAALLMPKEEMLHFLGSLNCDISKPIDMTIFSERLKEHFGVSNEALEYRLSGLGLAITNNLYGKRKKVIRESAYITDAEREHWSFRT